MRTACASVLVAALLTASTARGSTSSPRADAEDGSPARGSTSSPRAEAAGSPRAEAAPLTPSLSRGERGCTQVPLSVDGIGTPADELLRLGELSGAVPLSPRVLRRAGARVEARCAEGALPWDTAGLEARAGADGVRLVPLRLDAAWNSHYPSGGNDGLLWAGRGTSSMLSGGASFRWGALSGALAPAVSWSQNRWFTTRQNGQAGDLAFRNPFYGDGIDYPQRFGAGPFADWSLGQSYLRADAWNVAVGISTENLWIGPGIRNALTMTNAAPGFPHAFVGTSRPANIGIGTAEVLVYWGRLSRSTYVAHPTHPMVSGLVLDYTPRWVPGLTVGLSRQFVQVWDGLRVGDWLAVFQSPRKNDLKGWYDDPTGNNPNDNQLASLFARWVFPEARLEIYGEFGREDHEGSLYQYVRETDHTGAYLLGLQKLFGGGARTVRLQLEATALQAVRPPDSLRGMPSWYTHARDLSWTNEGQLLGASIGPGSDSQTVAVDVFGPRGRIGGYLERVRRDNAYYWSTIEPLRDDALTQDVEVTAGARQLLLAGPFEVSWDASASYRWSRAFLPRNEPNLRLVVQVALPLTPTR
ncbi:hypothetical protein Adeh_4294 [Anaeromyxobacter dehalogenans 2CP-C]|uniref:Capsule assembly protein Wzi n=1 Tax=Anaeromyxobacter dehalogenans (strain 2CP-C) TaxID=290397 RepID=Q2IHJ9_ANADE|nr:hypothetical protein Adeh_4294 [Anaeromyxobacter dehalogenans 2CP-C]